MAKATSAFWTGVTVLMAIAILMSAPRAAQAIPSFARQTGFACGVCHTAFPQLTPAGRLFKIMGYTQSAPGTKALGTPGWVPPIHGGAITEHIGAFAQATYAGPQFGPNQFMWDNLDVRYANFKDTSVVYGVSVNNSPTVQDPWNTTPAFGFPFVASNLSNTPGAKALIDNGFAAHVIGATAYVFINDTFYLEGGGYGTLAANTQNALGVVALNGPQTSGAIPYFRVAYAPKWGNHSWEVGAFGLSANVTPAIVVIGTGFNQFRELGLDSQYQYFGEGYVVTLRETYIYEYQLLNASFASGLAANPSNTLNTFRSQAELALGGTVRGRIGRRRNPPQRHASR
jgi:hypothetical protein